MAMPFGVDSFAQGRLAHVGFFLAIMKRLPAKMPPFPCGCVATTDRRKGGQSSFTCQDGTRVCVKHGKKYRMVWELVKG